jgi:hypothetical protein
MGGLAWHEVAILACAGVLGLLLLDLLVSGVRARRGPK